MIIRISNKNWLFLNQRITLNEYFKNNLWPAKVVYFADIFLLINDLTLSVQNNFFIYCKKIKTSVRIFDLWSNKVETICFHIYYAKKKQIND